MTRALALAVPPIAMAALVLWWIWPAPLRPMFTEDQLNACAAEAMVQDTMKNRQVSRAEAEEMAALEGYGNILGTARAYNKRFGGYLRTMYDDLSDEAVTVCIRHTLVRENIVMPNYGPRPGYHITRSSIGSASVVRDGDPEPTFGCADGYYSTGTPARPDGSGGCQRR